MSPYKSPEPAGSAGVRATRGAWLQLEEVRMRRLSDPATRAFCAARAWITHAQGQREAGISTVEAAILVGIFGSLALVVGTLFNDKVRGLLARLWNF